MKTQLCQCGCGKPTPIAKRTTKKIGHFKGYPIRFLYGHNLRLYHHGSDNGRWKGGKYVPQNGYSLVLNPNHPRANRDGYVLDHILIAEKAVGRYLSEDTPIHHFPENPSNQLIICQDDAYHFLLHCRQRAFEATGHANWKKCIYCKQFDDPINLHVFKSHAYHGKCRSMLRSDRKH